MNLLKRITDILLFTNTYLGICFVALYLALPPIHFGHTEIIFCLFIFFSTIAVYSALRTRALIHGAAETSLYLQWLTHHYSLARAAMTISFLITISLFCLLPRSYQAGVLALAPIWILYNLPFFSRGRIRFGLRYVWFLKPFVVALIISALCTLLPLTHSSGIHYSTMVLWLISFCFVSALVVVFEIKDMRHDSSFGTETIPMKIGEAHTIRLVTFLLAISILLTYTVFGLGIGTYLRISPLVLLIFYCHHYIKTDTNDYVYWIVLDGWMLIFGASWYLVDYFIH